MEEELGPSSARAKSNTLKILLISFVTILLCLAVFFYISNRLDVMYPSFG